MDEKKQDDISEVLSDITSETVPEPTPSMAAEVDAAAPAPAPATAAPTAFNVRAYAGAVAVILVIAGGLIFVLEKQGRLETGLFTGLITKLEANNPVATVNGVTIAKSEYESSLTQLLDMAATQGTDTTDEATLAGLQNQAVETLINAELLRQAALVAGMTASAEAIDARFNEIRDGIGGEEALAARMAEFNVTEASLRRDIENEILIQGLFDAEVTTTAVEVTDAEIMTLYNQAGGAEAGLPPLPDIREQIVAQIQFEKEQAIISEYIETLRSEAEIEVML